MCVLFRFVAMETDSSPMGPTKNLRPGGVADPSSAGKAAEVLNEWSSVFTPPRAFMACRQATLYLYVP